MYHWVRKIHMYAGLLSFTALLVYGIAGLAATFEAGSHTAPPEFVAFNAPPGATDKQIAGQVYRLLAPPLASPVPAWAIRRDREANIRLDFYSPNGVRHVTVLEGEKRLRVEVERRVLWQYLNGLHTATDTAAGRDIRMRLWGAYNQFAIAALLLLAASGLYLWLASRPRFRAAQLTFAAGAGVFVLLYALTR